MIARLSLVNSYQSKIDNTSAYYNYYSFLENGVTAMMFVQSDAEDYDDIELSKFGKRCVLNLLAEVKNK